MRLIVCLCAAVVLFAESNALTRKEAAEGWTLLFDGKTKASFRDSEDSWVIIDGCLVAVREPRILEDLVTRESYRNFELRFDYWLDSGANSGIKYKIWTDAFFVFDSPSGYDDGKVGTRASLKPGQRGQTYNLGFEFQLIDDERHADAAKGDDRRTGSLYALVARPAPAPSAAERWNTARLIVRGDTAEHWVNGTRVLAVNLTSDAVSAAVAKRLSRHPELIEVYKAKIGKPSPIAFQNHGDSVVRFRNIKIRRLD
jgi:hypothetical protein